MILHLIMDKLESPALKNGLCQVRLKLVQWFLKFVNLFSLFRYYLPLEKGVALHLNKRESPSPKDAFCQVWLKLVQWFWRFCLCGVFFVPLENYSLIWRRHALPVKGCNL